MVGSTLNIASFVGNGSTVTAYAIPFRYDAAGWVVVTLENPAGVVTTLEQVTDYTLLGDGTTAAGSFRTVLAYPSTHTLTVYRETPGIQSLDLPQNSPLPAVSLEAQLDRLAMAAADSATPRQIEDLQRQLNEIDTTPEPTGNIDGGTPGGPGSIFIDGGTP